MRARRRMPGPESRRAAAGTPPDVSKSVTEIVIDERLPCLMVPLMPISIRRVRLRSWGWVKSPTLSPSSIAATRQ